MTKYTPEMNNSNNFKQPEALQMAYELQIKAKALGFSLDPHAAELRRLHEVNQELLEFAKAVVRYAGNSCDDYLADKARAAIAKATGGAV